MATNISAALAAAPPPARRVVEVADATGLRAIRKAGTAVALWRRTCDPALAAWLGGLAPARLPQARALVPAVEAGALIDAACDEVGLLACPGRRALARDVGRLARAFGEALGTPTLGVRLEVVTTDACRRFHLDRVPARLLCTYRGRGTEFGLARGDAPAEVVARMTEGEVALLRGSLWPGPEKTALLHRSPPIAGTGETRLLLALDMPMDDEDEI